MTSIDVKIKEPFADSTYVLATVWVGPDPEHRQTTGTLHLTWDEALELDRRVKLAEGTANLEKVEAVMAALDIHRWRSMGVSSVECECGEILHGDESLTQFPADEAFRRHVAQAAVAAALGGVDA